MSFLKKYKNFVYYIIKLIIFILSYFYIIFLVRENINQDINFGYEFITIYKLSILSFVFILMVCNWFFESVKWRILINPLQHLSVIDSFKCVLAGLAVSLFTPNRIGELPGRLILLNSKNRISGLGATLIGSISQLFITVIFGILAILTTRTSFFSDFFSCWFCVIALFLYLIFTLLLLIYIYLFKNKHKFLFKYRFLKFLYFLTKYSKKNIVMVIFYSLIRYVIFSNQFYLLLLFFDVEIAYSAALKSIAFIYFALIFIPGFTLAEPGIRGTVAGIYFTKYSANILGVVSASTFLWIINLAIPSLIGIFIIYNFKRKNE